MRRKLIRQGGTGLTFYVPKKWVDSKGLKPGDEVDVMPFRDDLLVSPIGTSKEKKNITFPITEGNESNVRTLLVNAYRAGFDTITITFDGKEEVLQDLVDNYMLGFSLFKKDKEYVFENISEPSDQTFENIMQKQFYLITQILEEKPINTVLRNVRIVQKHDNFLKRCLAKKFYSSSETFFLWQFLSYLTQIAQLLRYYHKETKQSDEKSHETLVSIQKMFSFVKDAYFKKDFLILQKIYPLYKKVTSKNLKEVSPYLFTIARLVYIANSPLTGYLQLTHKLH